MNLTPVQQAPRMLADFETRSRVDLRECGAYRYAQDPSTQILCLGYRLPGQERKLWTPWTLGQESYRSERTVKKVKQYETFVRPAMVYTPELVPFPQDIIDHVVNGGSIEAHHAAFERAVWLYILHHQFGLPMCTKWLDTMATCAYRGLPLGLDEVGSVLNLHILKDKRGKDILRKISQPRKKTKADDSEWNNDPQLFQDCFEYCLTDVASEEVLGQTVGELPPSEFRIWTLDQIANSRGVKLDFDAVYAAKVVADKATDRLNAELVHITQGAIQTGGQRDEIIKHLKEKYDIWFPDLTKGRIKDALRRDKDMHATARRILEIRQEVSRTSTKKLTSMLVCVCVNGRICGLLQYHGAGTGRWAGRLVQPQNFPRPKVNGKPFKGDIEDLIVIIELGDPDIVRYCYGPEIETIAAALRGMFIAEDGHEFEVADYASIEARLVMWIAGQMDAMEIFEKADKKLGPDIYCYLAGEIYGRLITKEDADERQLGKIGVLGCGYQMSAPRLQEQAHDEYELDLEIELCERIVQSYRSKFHKVKSFWYGIERAACDAVIKNCAVDFNSIRYEPVVDKAGKWLSCRLPSGRRIWYYNPHTTMEPVPWDKNDLRPKLWYEGRDNKRGGMWSTITSYGGMLTENIVQAMARDIMAEAMVRVEKAGYPLILTVHDEIICEVPKDFGSHEEFEHLVAQQPVWAPGLPIAVEGWRGPRYKKG